MTLAIPSSSSRANLANSSQRCLLKTSNSSAVMSLVMALAISILRLPISAASKSSSVVNFMGRSFLSERWQSENSNGSRLVRPAIFPATAGQGV